MRAPDGNPRGAGRMLALVSAAVLLGMSPWFSATAVAPHLGAAWGLDAAAAAWLTGAVQVGFVAGTACLATFNLADLLPSRALFALSALLAAASNAALLAAPGYGAALVARFLTGCFLAGVYPPAMKMIATWFRAWRGLAIGVVVGALTAGKATPYLLHALDRTPMLTIVLATSAAALAAAAVVALAYRDGPFAFPRRPFAWSRCGEVLRNRETRLAIGGYLGHMWELYAMWTWVPAYLAAGAAARAAAGRGATPEPVVDLVAFGAIAAGAAGCVWGGWWAARVGYGRVVQVSMALSGACAVLAWPLFGAPLAVAAALTWAWGFFVVSDSAQFSAAVTEVAPPHAVGTALTLQVSLGFLLTTATIQLVPAIAGRAGWAAAFPVLALGPALGIVAIRGLAPRHGRAA